MFAKLKKKIQDEGSPSSVNETDGRLTKLPSPGPGIASPVKLDFSGASPFRKDSARDFDTTSVSSEVSDVRDTTSKEDLLRKLLKKNEQIKKLENKITDVAAMVRERNKTIEKLETAQEKLKQETCKKIEELETQLSTEKKNLATSNTEEMNGKIQALEAEKSKLEEQIAASQQFKENLLQLEEEREEMTGLTTQELAKVKHLLLNTQSELQKKETELSEKTNILKNSEKKVKELNSEIQSLMQQISEITTRSEEVEEENSNNRAMLQQLQGIHGDISHRNEELRATREQLDKLQHSYDILHKKSHTYQAKMAKLVEEKDEHISHQRERVQTLEQRLQDGELSGDERIGALEKERSLLEEKLTETREQLSQVKVSWSDKISHLETQISHLNTKIAEDNEELMATHLETENVKEKCHKQVAELQSQVDRAEKECHRLEDKLRTKQAEFEHQDKEHSSELLREKLHWTSLETELREKVTDLHRDLDALQRTREHEKLNTQQKVAKLEASQAEYLEKEIDLEKQITRSEDKVTELKTALEEQQKELEKQGETDGVLVKKQQQISELQEKVASLTQQVTDLQKQQSDLDKEYHKCTDENDSLLLRNAQLSQEYESFKRKTREQLIDLETELQQKNHSIAGLEEVLQEMQTEAKATNQKMLELENQQLVAVTEIESEEIKKLQKEIKDSEDQLLDRNKTIKKLQQRMTDLKKMLQRELNVQSLPNDETLNLPKDMSSKPSSTFNGPIQTNSTRNDQSYRSTPLQTFENHHSNGDAGSLTVAGDGTKQPDSAQFYAGNTDFCASDLENLLKPKSKQLGTASKPGYSNFYAGVQYDRDINFDYLKHVILKFVLSRETEAVHLVKAVAVLLDFNPDEQKLIKETLEYKMSWFGNKPRLGQGQYSKFIPPPV